MNKLAGICVWLCGMLGFFLLAYEVSYFIEEVQGGWHYSVITNLFSPSDLKYFILIMLILGVFSFLFKRKES